MKNYELGGFKMDHTFEELKKKTVAELRDIAAGIGDEAVKGYTQLNKEHLLEAVCKTLKIDMHVHHEVVGIDKSEIKSQIRELKKKRAEAISAKRIISTAPIEKLGTIRQPGSSSPQKDFNSLIRSSVKPEVPTTTPIPLVCHFLRFSITTSGCVHSGSERDLLLHASL